MKIQNLYFYYPSIIRKMQLAQVTIAQHNDIRFISTTSDIHLTNKTSNTQESNISIEKLDDDINYFDSQTGFKSIEKSKHPNENLISAVTIEEANES